MIRVRRTIRICIEFVVLMFAAVLIYLEELFHLLIPKKRKSLDGEVVLITGAANGLGKEISREIAKHNRKVTLVLWDVSEEDNKNTANKLRSDFGANVFEDTVDVSDRNQVVQAAAKLRSHFGDVTILVNNAGICPMQQFLELTPEAIQKSFETNVIAHFWTVKEFLPHMVQVNRGHIVTTCSTMGQMAIRGPAPYYATKHAVHGFIECLKDELAHMPRKSNIKFTTAYPFFINTRMVQGNDCGLILKFKFPSITPFMDADVVARRIVDGIRRETEYLYIPEVFRIYLAGKFFLPSKLHRLSVDFFVEESGYSVQLGTENGSNVTRTQLTKESGGRRKNETDQENRNESSFTNLLNYSRELAPSSSSWQRVKMAEKEK